MDIKGIIPAGEGYKVVAIRKIKAKDKVFVETIKYNVICFGIIEEENELPSVQPIVFETEEGNGLTPMSELEYNSYKLLYNGNDCMGTLVKTEEVKDE